MPNEIELPPELIAEVEAALPCDLIRRIAALEGQVAELQRREKGLREVLTEVASEGTKMNPCWCLTRMDEWDREPRAESDHDEWCVKAKQALASVGEK